MAERRLALVVATDRYEDPTLHGLAAPAADAEALAQVLGDPDLGAFEVEVLQNPTSSVAAEHVERLLAERHPSDLVLLHFSCHGLKDDSGELFLAATNTRPTLLASTAVDSALVNRMMRRSRAQRIVLLLDCCYGGAFERGVVTRADSDVHVGGQFSQGQLGAGRGRVVITSSSAMEYALDGTGGTVGGKPQPSLFTGALVNGLRSGEADRDQDGQVGLDELYDYVFDTVKKHTPNQTPSRWEFGLQGELVIARNPRRRILPAPVPADISDLAQHPTVGARLGAIDELARVADQSNLQKAAGAVLLLNELRHDDSRRVSEAAADELRRIAPTTPQPRVDLGSIAMSTTAAVEIAIQGGPLALASIVQTSSDEIQARIAGSALHIEVTAAETGPLAGWVSLSGPAGELRIEVAAAVVGAESPHIDTNTTPLPKQRPKADMGGSTPVPVEANESAEHASDDAVPAPVPSEPAAPTTISRPSTPGRRGLLAATALVVAGTAVALGLYLRSDGPPAQGGQVPAAFTSPVLYDYARPLFDAENECFQPEWEQAPLISDQPHTDLVRCESATEPYAAVMWCDDDQEDFENTREVYLGEAVPDTIQPISGARAGAQSETDGVQVSFEHRGRHYARVYWDSVSDLCAAELQADHGDVAAAVEFWHTGAAG